MNYKTYKYKGININYVDFGDEKKKPIVYLHGWGQNIEMMLPIAKPFIKKNRLIILDLPGFGKSEEPKEIWSLEDYAEMLNSLLKELKIAKPNLIGHSFGGKISIVYSLKYPVDKLILLSSPYKVKIQKLSWKVKMLKKLKNVPGLNKLANTIKSHIGSRDYKAATPKMRDILVKHINTDLENEVKKINCPTFIIWGTNDGEVSVEDAYSLENAIPNSGLSVYEGCTHYAYLENLNKTNAIIDAFINK